MKCRVTIEMIEDRVEGNPLVDSVSFMGETDDNNNRAYVLGSTLGRAVIGIKVWPIDSFVLGLLGSIRSLQSLFFNKVGDLLDQYYNEDFDNERGADAWLAEHIKVLDEAETSD